MKPSERINEIIEEHYRSLGVRGLPVTLGAIMQHLDERHAADNDPSRQLTELRAALNMPADATHEQALEVARQGVAALTLEGFESRDSAALQSLREAIDENLKYPTDEAEETGDYESAVRFASDRLSLIHTYAAGCKGTERDEVSRDLMKLLDGKTDLFSKETPNVA